MAKKEHKKTDGQDDANDTNDAFFQEAPAYRAHACAVRVKIL